MGIKQGFTLAEILITLGIIGVVSVLSMPTLVVNYKKQTYVTSLHKVYNEFNQVFERYLSDQRVETLAETELMGGVNSVGAFLKDYFKIAKECGAGSTACFGDSYTTLKGTSAQELVNINVGHADAYSVMLTNGASISMKIAGNCNNNAENSNYCGLIYVDTNGAKAPNRIGRDFFTMYFYPSGNIDEAQTGSDTRESYFTLLCQNGFLIGCFGKILNDNWKMNY